MDTLFLYLKKTLVLTIFIMFAFVATYIPQPVTHYKNVPQAEAALPTIDVANVVQTTATAVSTAFTAAVQGALQIKEFTLDAIAWAIAKSIVSRMVASTIDWINSGFEGSPRFVQDLTEHLDRLAGTIFEDFIDELGGDGSFLCSPFKLDILIALEFEYYQVGKNRPYRGCTLTGIIDNVDSFMAGNFSEAGWKGWFDITMNPQKYTPFGQLQEARKEQDRRIAEAKNSEAQTISQGNGFLPTKVCDEPATPEGKKKNCKIVLPGKAIADSLTKNLGSGQDALIQADEISELIGALLNQLMVKAITGTAGLLGLSAGTKYTYQGYESGSYLADLRTEADSQIGAGLAGGATRLTDAMKVQRAYQTAAVSYSSRFKTYIGDVNLDSEKLSIAQSGYLDTQKVIGKTGDNITEIQTLIDSYLEMEAEYNKPTTGQERRTEIRNLQASILSNFTKKGYYTEAEYTASKEAWDAKLAAITAP